MLQGPDVKTPKVYLKMYYRYANMNPLTPWVTITLWSSKD